MTLAIAVMGEPQSSVWRRFAEACGVARFCEASPNENFDLLHRTAAARSTAARTATARRSAAGSPATAAAELGRGRLKFFASQGAVLVGIGEFKQPQQILVGDLVLGHLAVFVGVQGHDRIDEVVGVRLASLSAARPASARTTGCWPAGTRRSAGGGTWRAR